MSAENGCLAGLFPLVLCMLNSLSRRFDQTSKYGRQRGPPSPPPSGKTAMNGAKNLQLPGLWLHFCHTSWFGGLCGNLPYVYE